MNTVYSKVEDIDIMLYYLYNIYRPTTDESLIDISHKLHK